VAAMTSPIALSSAADCHPSCFLEQEDVIFLARRWSRRVMSEKLHVAEDVLQEDLAGVSSIALL